MGFWQLTHFSGELHIVVATRSFVCRRLLLLFSSCCVFVCLFVIVFVVVCLVGVCFCFDSFVVFYLCFLALCVNLREASSGMNFKHVVGRTA